jgi:hypothetical protein
MTQEDKDLLLKYICMALPYRVKVYCGEDFAMTLRQIDYQCYCESYEIEDIKSHSRWNLPYLRPMSGMTEEEKAELFQLMGNGTDIQRIDFYLSHHFDFMGLIPKGLAIEVNKENNPYKN